MGRDAVTTRTLGRVFWLRALVVASLLLVAAVIGSWAYAILRESESTQAESLYDSVSVAALVNTQRSFTRASKGATTLASLYSGAHPTETAWPNVALGEFAERAAQLADIASVDKFGFAPVLRPDQVAAWETFAFNLWDTDPLMLPGRGFIPPAGPGLPPRRGIWNFNPRIPLPGALSLDDGTGNTTWGDSDTLRILLPSAQQTEITLLGLSTYPDEVMGPVIEKTLLCAVEKAQRGLRARQWSPLCASQETSSPTIQRRHWSSSLPSPSWGTMARPRGWVLPTRVWTGPLCWPTRCPPSLGRWT
ncbi:hypothetical protein B484DRAFT_53700 [Ochromonadaceae sp. CCMP2298]|nr:hypothetical protein B484DRAFT_53700 [Ochromonadaceae sp. CCMP2298]